MTRISDNPALLKAISDGLQGIFTPAPTMVTLMRESWFDEPIHAHWWQGWRHPWARIKEWAFDDVYVQHDTYDDFWEEHVGQKWSPGPLSDLLRPVHHVRRLIPASDSVKASARREGSSIVFDPVGPFAPIPGSSITHLTLTDAQGHELATTNMVVPTPPIAPLDTVVITRLDIEIS